MSGMNRRTFLGAAGLVAAAPAARARASAAERVRVAIIGARGRGTDLAQEFARDKNAESWHSATSTTRRLQSR